MHPALSETGFQLVENPWFRLLDLQMKIRGPSGLSTSALSTIGIHNLDQ